MAMKQEKGEKFDRNEINGRYAGEPESPEEGTRHVTEMADMIRPFTILEPTDQKQQWEEKKQIGQVDSILDSTEQMIRPFDFISADIVAAAEEITNGDPVLAREFATIMHRYCKNGGNINHFLATKSNTEKVGNLNFDLTLIKKIFKIFDSSEGELSDMLYAISIIVYKTQGNTQNFYAEIDSDKIKDPNWLKKATHSLASIPQTKTDKAIFANAVQQCIEAENITIERIYDRAGWRNIPGKGWKYVFRDGAVGENSNDVHSAGKICNLLWRRDKVGTYDVFQRVMAAADICGNKRTSAGLLLFMHLGLLTTLFHLAGHDIDFSYMIVGPTNCRKTSLVTAIAKVFDRENLKSDAEFATATSAGIEQTLGLYKDATVIIDDYKAGANLTQQREMNRKLDEVIRFYGDRIQKKRMLAFTHDKKKLFFPIGGNCVITGEFAPEAIESSMTRIFLSEVTKDDVDNNKLRIFQDERWLIPTHAYDFLQWVTHNFQTCVAYIRESFPIYRETHNYVVGRYGGMYADFMIAADFICMYAKDKGFWDDTACAQFTYKVKKVIEVEFGIMEDRFRQRDKGTQILIVLKYVVENKIVRPVYLDEISCSRSEEFYEDQTRYFIQTKFLRRILDNYNRERSDSLTIINNEELIVLLDRKDALEVIEHDGKRVRSRKLPIQKGNWKRYLYIKKEIFSCIDDN